MGEKELLEIVTEIAVKLTQYGGEIYRAEESVMRICSAYGHSEAETFIIPAGIIITIKDRNGRPVTSTCRVKDRTVNLDRVDRYNSLSRYICRAKPVYQVIRREINRIEERRVYGRLTNFLCNIIIGAAFALFFGGGAAEAFCAALSAAIIFLVEEGLSRNNSGIFMKSVFCSMSGAVLALLLSRTGLTESFDKVTISALMTLVPGVAITNCMRDFIAGDLLAGLYTMTEAVITAAGIAVGAGTVLAVFIHI